MKWTKIVSQNLVVNTAGLAEIIKVNVLLKINKWPPAMGSWELVSLVCPCLCSTFETVCPIPQSPGDPMLLRSGTRIPEHISFCHWIAFLSPLPALLQLFLRICSTKGNDKKNENEKMCRMYRRCVCAEKEQR